MTTTSAKYPLPPDVDLGAYTSRDHAAILERSASDLQRVASLEMQRPTRRWFRRQARLLTAHAAVLRSEPDRVGLVIAEWESLTDDQRAVMTWNQLCARMGYSYAMTVRLRTHHAGAIMDAGWVLVWDGANTGLAGTGYRLERFDDDAGDETST